MGAGFSLAPPQLPADLTVERYNLPDTLKGQHIFYLRHPYCLHSDMGRVLANLRGCLNPGGHLYLWVYGKHGRYRHSLNMRLLAMLTGPGAPGAWQRAGCWSTVPRSCRRPGRLSPSSSRPPVPAPLRSPGQSNRSWP